MKKYVIITDSSSDLSKGLQKKHNIICMPIDVRFDDKIISTNLDWEEYSVLELYRLMKKTKKIEELSVSMSTLIDTFSNYLEYGFDIIYIACSNKVNDSYKNSLVVKKLMEEKYPNKNIYCIDSVNSSMGQGSMCITASIMRDLKKTAEEVCDYIEDNKYKIHQVGIIDDARYLKEKELLSSSQYFFGKMFNLKPIIISGKTGRHIVYKRASGFNKGLKEVVKYIKGRIYLPNEQTIYIAHANNIEKAKVLREMVINNIKPKDVEIGEIGPYTSCTTGDGSILVYFLGESLTEE